MSGLLLRKVLKKSVCLSLVESPTWCQYFSLRQKGILSLCKTVNTTQKVRSMLLQVDHKWLIFPKRRYSPSAVPLKYRRIVCNLTTDDAEESTSSKEDGENKNSDLEMRKKISEILVKHGLHPETLNRRKLRVTPMKVDNYIQIMKETKFLKIKSSSIIHFKRLSRNSIANLKQKKLISEDADVLQIYCNLLNVDRRKILKFLNVPESNIELLPWVDVRAAVTLAYISSQLNTTIDEVAQHYIFKEKRMLFKSYACMTDILKVLRETLNFSSQKILSHLYLLISDKENIEQLKRELPVLVGSSLDDLIANRPKLVMSKVSNIKAIMSAFNEYGIDDKAVARYPQLFTLSVNTIRKRLKKLKSDPLLHPMVNHPQVGRILYYYTKIVERLKYFENINVEPPSINVLTCDSIKFAKFVSEGDFKNRGKDVVFVLCKYFNKPYYEFRKSMARHPHWLNVSYSRIQDTLKYFEDRGDISKEQIYEALPILLYSRYKIDKELESILANKEASLDDLFILHLVLYYLERPVHFTGDGVWPSETISFDDEDVEEITELQ